MQIRRLAKTIKKKQAPTDFNYAPKIQANQTYPRIYNKTGMTLIEVLLALLILGIALTAAIHTTSVVTKTSFYVEQKTLATWVGLNLINEIQAGVRPPPLNSEPTEGQTTQGEKTWDWTITETNTKNPDIKAINIKIYTNKHLPLTQLTGYRYAPKKH